MALKSANANYADACDGGQPVKDDDHAAAVLAQGSNRSKKVPQTWGMKDQQSAGHSYTGR